MPHKDVWPMVGALAALGALWLAFRNQPLASEPLTFSPPNAGDAAAAKIKTADTPNTAQLQATNWNSPTYAGWREPGFVSTFLGGLTRRTWGVPTGPTRSPSPVPLPEVGIVPGQTPYNAQLITDATGAQETPSTVIDQNVAEPLAGDLNAEADNYDPLLG